MNGSQLAAEVARLRKTFTGDPEFWRRRLRRCAILSCLLFALSPARADQHEAPAPAPSRAADQVATKQELLTRLRTKQAQLDLDNAKAAMDRAEAEFASIQRLYDERIVTIDDLKKAEHGFEQARLTFQQAQIDLEETGLEFLKDATLVTVVTASKSRAENGKFIVNVTLKNESNLGEARTAMEDVADLSDAQLRALLDIDNVIVRLVGEVARLSKDGEPRRSTEAIVGFPIQQRIDVLPLGETRQLTYELLRKDVDAVKIQVEYLGAKKEYPVFLRMEASQDLPTIVSTQFSQQGELGSRIKYDIELEYLGEDDRSFSLVVLNLPQEIRPAFLDSQSDARLTQVSFTDEISKQSLDLELSIPEKLDQSRIDRPIKFVVFVTHPSQLRSISRLRSQHAEDSAVPDEALKTIKGESVELVLTPKGTGKLDLLITNQFKEVHQQEPIQFKFRILNSGTLALTQVTPELDLPLEWEGVLKPKIASVIEPSEKITFEVDIIPPPDIVVGEYTVKILAEGHAGFETVDGLDKNFTVRVRARSNILGTLGLVGVLITLVVVLAVATVRISRR